MTSTFITLTISALASTGFGYPHLKSRDCNPSFILANPLFEEWGQGQFLQSISGGNIAQAGAFVAEFTTNSSSQAQVFNIEASTGRWFFTDANNNQYFAWSDEFEQPSVNFDLEKDIASKDAGGVPLFCDVPKANGDTFTCRGNNDTTFEQFEVTFGNEGEPLSLVEGKSTGPYPTPVPNQDEFAYEGGVRVEVQGLSCV